MKVEKLSEQHFDSDNTSDILFQDEHSFSFSRITLANISLKLSWNSKEMDPAIELISPFSVIFVAVDTYIVGYNYETQTVALFLRTITNFKWFETIPNGIAAVTETEIILINVSKRCTLRGCYGFGDIIMGTTIENNKMKISFLVDPEQLIPI